MDLTVIVFCVTTLAHIAVSVQGQYVLTTSCGGSVQAGGSCTLTCDTQGVAAAGIQWLNGSAPTVISGLDCTNVGSLPVPDYTANCNSAKSKFTLTFTNAVYGRDAVEWACDSAFGGRKSNILAAGTLVTVPLMTVSITKTPATITCTTLSNPAAAIKLIEIQSTGHQEVKSASVFTEEYGGKRTTLTYNLNDTSSSYYCQGTSGVVQINSSVRSPSGPPLVPLDFIITNTTQRSISLRWKPNFPGGDFTQMFILHYRLQGSGDWNTKEYEDNPGGYVYTDITDLQPGSVYEFKVKARNNRDMNHEGNFSEIVLGTTERLPGNGEPNSSIGVGLGIGLGICLPIIIGLIIALIYFYRTKLSLQSKGKNHPDNQGIGSPSGSRGHMSGQSRSQDQPEYAHLEQRSHEQYEQIRLYENTKGKSKDSADYENLQKSSPATYEKVDPHVYVNSVNDPKDPTYINRPKAFTEIRS